MKQKIIWVIITLVFFTRLQAQKDSLRLRCPIDKATVVPPSKENLKVNPDDLCVVIVSVNDTTVLACTGGRISNVEMNEGKWDVVFYYKDYYFWYVGLASVDVRRNQVIKKGQAIGRVKSGETMEFLLFQFETPLDPMKYLDCKK